MAYLEFNLTALGVSGSNPSDPPKESWTERRIYRNPVLAGQFNF